MGKILYAVCAARSQVFRTKQEKSPEQLLTGLKPSEVLYRSYGCRPSVIVHDKTRKSFKPIARSGALLSTLYARKFRVMLERSQAVDVSRRSIVNQNEFPVKKWKHINRVSENPVLESALIDENDDILEILDHHREKSHV